MAAARTVEGAVSRKPWLFAVGGESTEKEEKEEKEEKGEERREWRWKLQK